MLATNNPLLLLTPCIFYLMEYLYHDSSINKNINEILNKKKKTICPLIA